MISRHDRSEMTLKHDPLAADDVSIVPGAGARDREWLANLWRREWARPMTISMRSAFTRSEVIVCHARTRTPFRSHGALTQASRPSVITTFRSGMKSRWTSYSFRIHGHPPVAANSPYVGPVDSAGSHALRFDQEDRDDRDEYPCENVRDAVPLAESAARLKHGEYPP